jgi:hypothetical protein
VTLWQTHYHHLMAFSDTVPYPSPPPHKSVTCYLNGPKLRILTTTTTTAINTTLKMHSIYNQKSSNTYTVKHKNFDHPWNSKFVAVVDRWLFFDVSFTLKQRKIGPKKVGRNLQVNVKAGLTVH